MNKYIVFFLDGTGVPIHADACDFIYPARKYIKFYMNEENSENVVKDVNDKVVAVFNFDNIKGYRKEKCQSNLKPEQLDIYNIPERRDKK